METGEIIAAWISVGLTFVMFSFLYKDNPLFKFGEHLYVGLGTGYTFCYACCDIVWPDLIRPLYRAIAAGFGETWEKEPLQSYESYWLLIPLFFSILILTRFLPRANWPSRWSFAFITGTVSGMAIPYVTSAAIFKQIVPTLQPLYQPGNTVTETILETGGAILILVGVISVLVYFFFSMEHTGAVKTVAKIGVLYMMICFGAAFGYTVMGRETLVIARFREIINSSGAEYGHASIVMLLVVALLIALLEVGRRRPPDRTSE